MQGKIDPLESIIILLPAFGQTRSTHAEAGSFGRAILRIELLARRFHRHPANGNGPAKKRDSDGAPRVAR